MWLVEKVVFCDVHGEVTFGVCITKTYNYNIGKYKLSFVRLMIRAVCSQGFFSTVPAIPEPSRLKLADCVQI